MSPRQECDNDDNNNNSKLQKWIEKVKSEGDIPHLPPDNCINGWSTPLGKRFMIRGVNYLFSRKKVPGGDYLLRPLGFDWIRSDSKICDVLRNQQGRVRKSLMSTGLDPFIWAFHLQLPYKNYSLISYFVACEPVQEGSLMERFLKGDDEFKKSRLKMIANVVEGPWIVKAAVGKQAASILGRANLCRFIVGENYLEVEIDVGVSMFGTAVARLCFGYIQALTVDLAFLIEGQDESELPEQILGAVRFSQLNPDSAGILDQPGEKSDKNLWTHRRRGLRGAEEKVLPASF